jgi:hypothetical protein
LILRRRKAILISKREAVGSEMKVPFEIVNTEVEKMFAAGRQGSETLSDFLLRVEEFIESCGWDVDEFETKNKIKDTN